MSPFTKDSHLNIEQHIRLFMSKEKDFTSFKRESDSHWLMEHNWFVCLDSELRNRSISVL